MYVFHIDQLNTLNFVTQIQIDFFSYNADHRSLTGFLGIFW